MMMLCSLGSTINSFSNSRLLISVNECVLQIKRKRNVSPCFWYCPILVFRLHLFRTAGFSIVTLSSLKQSQNPCSDENNFFSLTLAFISGCDEMIQKYSNFKRIGDDISLIHPIISGSASHLYALISQNEI